MKNRRYLQLPILCGVLLLGAATLRAQATRTWVSGVGDDANPCSRTAPCKTFAGAISKTAAFGEINVLDPGGFGGLTIGKSITVRSDSIEAGVLVAGTNGFLVNVASTDRVSIEGLDFEGLGAPQSSLDGIKTINSGVVRVDKCRINGFRTGSGVNVAGVLNAVAIVSNCRITNCTGGVNVAGQGGVANFATILDSTLDGNSSFALEVVGAADNASVAKSYLINSPAGIQLLSGGTATSFGPSNIVTGSGAFTGAPIPFK